MSKTTLEKVDFNKLREMMENLPKTPCTISVCETTTIENNPNIVKLVNPYIHKRNDTVTADLFDYIKIMAKGRFDLAFLDIWRTMG